MKRLICILLLCCLSGCAASQTLAQQEKTYTLGVLLKAMDSQHWLDMRSGLNDAAHDFNVDLVLLYPENENDILEQTQMFYDLADRKPDAILYAPCDSGACAPLAAYAGEIPVITLDTPATDIKLPYVGADNERIGRMAATRLGGLLERKGKVAIIAGMRDQASHVERVKGFELALAGYPEIEIEEIYYGDSTFYIGMQFMDRLRWERPDVKGVFCTNAMMSLGAVEQLQSESGADKPFIVAVDTQDDTLSALRAGALQGIVTQDGYEAGYEAVRYALDYLQNKPLPEVTYIKTDLLVPNMVEEYIQSRWTRTEGKH